MIKKKRYRMSLKQSRYNFHNGINQIWDFIIEGDLEGQNGFGLRFNEYSNGDIIELGFFRGNSICLYREDIEKLIKYLKNKLKVMK